MSLRRFVAISLSAALALPLAPLQEAMAQAPVQVIHSPVGCMVANQFPQLEATAPAGAVVNATRAYFRSGLSPDLYYVEGTPAGAGRFLFVLPQPRVEASPITYYIEFLPDGRTEDYTAIVVERASECKDRAVAPISPTGPASVFGPGGLAAGAPIGFGLGAAALAIGGGVSTGLLIAGGALAIGAVGVGVAVVTDEDDPPPSAQPTNPPTNPPTAPPTTPPTAVPPTPPATPTPRPTPTPTPTPRPPRPSPVSPSL
jgi:hypothetical protein